MNRRVVIALTLAAAAAPAVGQEARFLQPAAPEVNQGGTIRLSVVEAGRQEHWPAGAIAHFFARSAWTQENRDTLDTAEGVGSQAEWVADRPGVMVLGCDLQPRVESVPAESFAAFVGRVLPASRWDAFGTANPAGEIAVRRVESAKAIVRVIADGEEPVSIATSKTGQPVEIRPLMDPTAMRPGDDLLIKVYAQVPGPAEGMILATNTTTGEALNAPTRDDATANLTIPTAGNWRLEFHAVTPLDDPDAQWLVHTATLTFHIAGAPARHEAEVTR